MKKAQRQLEFLEIQEGYIKDEMKNLKREMIRAKEVRALTASCEQALLIWTLAHAAPLLCFELLRRSSASSQYRL